MAFKALHDEEKLNELYNYIKVGNYVGTACAAVGISQTTYYRWLTIGKRVDDLCEAREDEAEEWRDKLRAGQNALGIDDDALAAWHFRDNIMRATALAESYAVTMVRSQMPNQWQAAMTYLERRFPGRWKRREQIDVGEADGTATGIDETLLLEDPEAVRLVHEALQRVSQPLQLESGDEKSPLGEGA